MPIRFLHTNDLHGALSPALLARLAELRAGVDLYFDSGDGIKTGNLGVPLRPEPYWERLAALNCSASTLGNRESHVLEAAFRAKLAGATHPIVVANLRRRDGSMVFAPSRVLDAGGRRVGVLGVMVPMVTPRMRTQAASAFLWDPPAEAAARVARELRATCDLVVALTHIGFRQDRELAEAVPEIDLVFGGHSHTVLERPERVGRTWIAQGGSHGRFAGLYEWDGATLTGGLHPLKDA